MSDDRCRMKDDEKTEDACLPAKAGKTEDRISCPRTEDDDRCRMTEEEGRLPVPKEKSKRWEGKK